MGFVAIIGLIFGPLVCLLFAGWFYVMSLLYINIHRYQV